MATTVVSYERGTTYVTNIADSDTCYALVGSLWVGGLAFDTLERFSLKKKPDFVHLSAKDHTTAVMYWHSKLGRVINPLNGTGTSKLYNNILVHAGSKPSHYKGCIGPGFLEKHGDSQRLSLAKESMELIWEQCGGAPGVKPEWSRSALSILFRVENAFPDPSSCTPHRG